MVFEIVVVIRLPSKAPGMKQVKPRLKTQSDFKCQRRAKGGGGRRKRTPGGWLGRRGLRQWGTNRGAVRLSKVGQLALKYLVRKCTPGFDMQHSCDRAGSLCCRLIPKLDHNEQGS